MNVTSEAVSNFAIEALYYIVRILKHVIFEKNLMFVFRTIQFFHFLTSGQYSAYEKDDIDF